MTQEWLEGLREFLYDMMEPFVQDDNFRAALLDEEQMPIWAAAFTNETFDHENNYEDIEYIGIDMIKAAFPLYMIVHFPNENITEKILTESKNKYMSKKELAIRSKKYGFSNWVRTNSNEDLNVNLYQSFVGALYLSSDQIISIEKNKKKSKFDLIKNDSFRLVKRFITYDMNQLNIELDTTPAKSMIVQSLRRIGVVFKNSEVIEFFVPNNPKSATDLSGTGTIRLTPAMVAIIASKLREDGIYKQIPNIIGVAYGTTKDDALKNAYSNAKLKLEEIGFTEEWSKNKKRQIQWKMQDPMLVDRANKKAKNEGYDKIEIINVRSTGRADQVVQLLSKNKVLSSGIGIDERQAIENALKEFLKI